MTKLPPVGIVIGSIEDPKAVVGLTRRPKDLPLADWLSSLKRRGCNVRIAQAASFTGSIVECAADGRCDLRRHGNCPLDPPAN